MKLSAKKATRLSSFIVCAALFFLLFGFKPKHSQQEYQLRGYAQGTTYHISYYHSKALVTKNQIDSIITAIDSSLSIYKDYSLITAFNHASIGVKMDLHLQNVVEKSIAISKESKGAFDITVYPLVNAWGFGLSKPSQPPTAAEIKTLLQNVGYQHLKIEGQQLLKLKPAIQIDVNGIAQGYTVDVIASFLEQNGLHNYLAELGGELRVKGRKAENQLFKIGIEAVNDTDVTPIKKYIEISIGAITTSGNYRKFIEWNAVRTNHIINPKTGYYQKNDLISVTVYAPTGIIADGYDNVLMNLGLKNALRFLAKKKEISAYFVYQQNGIVKDTCSMGFPIIKEF